jgi:hypothetical protein
MYSKSFSSISVSFFIVHRITDIIALPSVRYAVGMLFPGDPTPNHNPSNIEAHHNPDNQKSGGLMSEFIVTEAQQLFRSDSPREKAPAPAVGLKTGISRALIYDSYMENVTIAVAGDGSIWTATKSALSQYSAALNRPVKVCDMAYPNPGILNFDRYIAPVSSQRAFFIQFRADKRVVSEYQHDHAVTDLPALPDAETPAEVSAASDGTLWVLGSSGKPWLYESTGKWKAAPADPGTTITQISVASAAFVLALAQRSGQTVLLSYSNGKWSDHATHTPAGIKWVGACPDGHYWWSSAALRVAGELHLVRPGLADLTFPIPGMGASGFTAATRRSCYFFSMDLFSYFRAAYGVLDQPDQDWPTMNAEEKKGYTAISSALGITDPGGIRSQYTNAVATFSIWYTKVSQMAKPANVAEADWLSIQHQIKDELEYVQGLSTLFVNIALLNQAVGLVNTNTYNQVVKMVELPDTPAQQPKTLVSLIFDKLVGKLESAIIGKAKAFMGSEVVDIGMACFKLAGDGIAKEHNLPDGSVPLIIACSDLAGTLASAVVKTEQARATIQHAILSDWGRLGACGEAIRTGVWFWRPGLTADTIKDAGESIALTFYQTLMPAKWKVILVEGLLSYQPPMNPFMPNVPGYSLMHKWVADKSGNRLYWWWACVEVSATVEQRTEGPFPHQRLMETIFALDTQPLDFFTCTNGWNLPVAQAGGYGPPPDGLVWQDYINSSKPFG